MMTGIQNPTHLIGMHRILRFAFLSLAFAGRVLAQPPRIEHSSPQDGQDVFGRTVDLKVQQIDGNNHEIIEKVEFKMFLPDSGSTAWVEGAFDSAQGTWTLNTNTFGEFPRVGTYSWRARAINQYNAIISPLEPSEFNVVDSTDPVVGPVLVTRLGSAPENRYKFSANAVDDFSIIDKLDFELRNIFRGESDDGSDFSFEMGAFPDYGQVLNWEIRASAHDPSGNVGVSEWSLLDQLPPDFADENGNFVPFESAWTPLAGSDPPVEFELPQYDEEKLFSAVITDNSGTVAEVTYIFEHPDVTFENPATPNEQDEWSIARPFPTWGLWEYKIRAVDEVGNELITGTRPFYVRQDTTPPVYLNETGHPTEWVNINDPPALDFELEIDVETHDFEVILSDNSGEVSSVEFFFRQTDNNLPDGTEVRGFQVPSNKVQDLADGSGLWRVTLPFSVEGIWFYGFVATDPESNVLQTGSRAFRVYVPATEAPADDVGPIYLNQLGLPAIFEEDQSLVSYMTGAGVDIDFDLYQREPHTFQVRIADNVGVASVRFFFYQGTDSSTATFASASPQGVSGRWRVEESFEPLGEWKYGFVAADAAGNVLTAGPRTFMVKTCDNFACLSYRRKLRGDGDTAGQS